MATTKDGIREGGPYSVYPADLPTLDCGHIDMSMSTPGLSAVQTWASGGPKRLPLTIEKRDLMDRIKLGRSKERFWYSYKRGFGILILGQR